MTSSFVADASVAVGWVHPAQSTDETASTLIAIAEGATLEVPALWPLEVANALTVLERRGKLTAISIIAQRRASPGSRPAAIGEPQGRRRRDPYSTL